MRNKNFDFLLDQSFHQINFSPLCESNFVYEYKNIKKIFLAALAIETNSV